MCGHENTCKSPHLARMCALAIETYNDLSTYTFAVEQLHVDLQTEGEAREEWLDMRELECCLMDRYTSKNI